MIAHSYRVILSAGLIVGIASLCALPLTAQGATGRVGVAAAVNPATTGTPPGGTNRVIVVGDDMLQNERIETSNAGRTQLLFLDGSALTIGPNSSVVLDEFVYDPKTKIGKLAFTATKGLFRLVGGKISKKTPVTFTTPTAVIGIRGGIGIVTVREVNQQAETGGGLTAGSSSAVPSADGTLRLAQTGGGPRVVTTAQLAFGRMTVRSGGVTQAINIPGFQVIASNPQVAPSAPARAAGPSEGLQNLEGPGGGNSGGAPTPPTNEDVADTQIASMGSNVQPQNIVPVPAVGQPQQQTTTRRAVVVQKLEQLVQSTTDAQQNTTLDRLTGTTGGVRNAGISNGFSYGGRFLSQTPFTGFDFNTAKTSRVIVRNNRGTGGRVELGFIRSTSSLTDVPSFVLPVREGDFSFDASLGHTRFGQVSGRGFGAPDQSFFYLNLREAQFNNNPSSLFAGVAYKGNFPTTGIRVHDLFPGFPGLTTNPMLPKSYGGDIGGGPNPKLFSVFSPNLTSFPNDARSVALYGLVAIEGTGNNQRSAQIAYQGVFFGDSQSNNRIVLSGYSRGSVRLSSSSRPLRVDGGGGTTSQDGAGNAFFGLGGPDYFVISSDFTDGNSAPINAAGFVQNIENPGTELASFFHETYATPAGVPSGVGNSRSSQTLNGYIMGLVTVRLSASSFPVYIAQTLNDSPNNFKIVTNASTNRLYAIAKTEDTSESQSSLVAYLGNPSGTAKTRSAFIDDNIFGARESSSVSPTVDGNTGTSRLMMISSAFIKTSGAVTNGITFCECTHTQWGLLSGEVRAGDFSERHRFHLVPWVAGALSGAAITKNLTGSATYNGHVAANIMNNGRQYVALGNYKQVWDFGSRTGSARISELDGAIYTGSISGASGAQGSEFTGAISGNGRSGSLQGAFMRGAASTVGEVGVQFRVTGGNYYAVGVGAAKTP